MMTSSSMSLTPYQSQLLSKHRLVASCWMQNDERDQKRHILTSAIYQIGKISMKNRKKRVVTSSSESSNLSYLSLLLSKPRLVAYNWMQNEGRVQKKHMSTLSIPISNEKKELENLQNRVVTSPNMPFPRNLLKLFSKPRLVPSHWILNYEIVKKTHAPF